jgi:hypothetical protein
MTGDIVRLVLASADASAGVAFTIYDTRGVARVLASTERLVITDGEWVIAAGAGLVTVFSDNDADSAVDAGEELMYLSGANITSCIERYAARGKTVKGRAAAAGQVNVVLAGNIITT